MPYELSFSPKPGYLHAIVSGTNTKETVMRYLEAIQHECAARGYRRLLIEERLEGPRLDTIDVFQIAAWGSTCARGQLTALAYVDVNAKGGLMKFAETVAVNRALPVRVFDEVGDAEEWLQRSAE